VSSFTRVDLFPSLASQRRRREQVRDHDITLGRHMVGEEIYPPDLLFIGPAGGFDPASGRRTRPVRQLEGFGLAIIPPRPDGHLTRLAYMGSRPQMDELTAAVFDGAAFRSARDVLGQRLTDGRLVVGPVSVAKLDALFEGMRSQFAPVLDALKAPTGAPAARTEDERRVIAELGPGWWLISPSLSLRLLANCSPFFERTASRPF
jgi:hypothetical protein